MPHQKMRAIFTILQKQHKHHFHGEVIQSFRPKRHQAIEGEESARHQLPVRAIGHLGHGMGDRIDQLLGVICWRFIWRSVEKEPPKC